jgi:hypothetical protein
VEGTPEFGADMTGKVLTLTLLAGVVAGLYGLTLLRFGQMLGG